MNKTELKLQYDIVSQENNGVSVIIVAAGSSTRMKGTNKQLAVIGGIPVIIRTLLAFENSSKISNIILVARQEDVLEIGAVAEKYMISKLTDIVSGGATRQESVLKGFLRLSNNDKKVLIHDGARPFVSENIISSVVDALDKCSAVTCAVRVKDTIKEIDGDGKVLKTLNRESLVSVQTPQGVIIKDYLKAIENTDVSKFTDDTSIMENAGYEVLTVEGSYKNIKITTKEDLALGEGFLLGEDE